MAGKTGSAGPSNSYLVSTDWNELCQVDSDRIEKRSAEQDILFGVSFLMDLTAVVSCIAFLLNRFMVLLQLCLDKVAIHCLTTVGFICSFVHLFLCDSKVN